MIDPRTYGVLGLSPDAAPQQVATHLRELAGLQPKPDSNADLWMRFLEMVDWAYRFEPNPKGDEAQIANGIASSAIVPPGRPGEDRYGTVPWDRELDVPANESDEVLRGFAYDVIAPRLYAAGLIRPV